MLPVHSQGRAGHRRSYSQTTGPFSSLGALPRRRSSSNIPTHYPVPQTKKPTFHFRQDQDEDDDDDDDRQDDEHLSHHLIHDLPPLRLKLNTNSFNAVPFPRSSSPLHSPTVHLLSNGKPLKSSLKSSSSSPNIPFPSQSLVPSIMFPDLHPKHQQPHQRASSAPCTPLFTTSPESTSPSSSSPPSSQTHSPSSSFHHPNHVPKNVHFPSQEEGGLATIRVFNRSARPASLSRLGEETETETEGEGSSTGTGLYGNGGWAGWSGKYVGGSTFPFPRVPQEKEKEKKSPLNPATTSSNNQKQSLFEIDWSASSGIPRKNLDHGFENVFFDSLQVAPGLDDDTVLQGTLLVRNITYQKTVMVRYTLDDWETINDVAGWYHATDTQRTGWDRFKFSISLGTVHQALEKRVMWLVGKYAGAGEGGAVEWWDNNEGKNYRVGFKKVEEQQLGEKMYKRGVSLSAPATPTSTLTRPKLSAPQISSSSSFPFSGHQHVSQYQREREKERERERAQHQAAITESTFARLKKLNLKNYAAPRGYTYDANARPQPSSEQSSSSSLTPPVLTLTHPSPTTPAFPTTKPSPPPTSEHPTTPEISSPTFSTTSSDSTPLQTPTHEEDEDEAGWKTVPPKEDGLMRWSLGMENGHFATTLLPASPIGSGGSDDTTTTTTPTPTTSPIPVSVPGGGSLYANTAYPYPNYPSKSKNTLEMGTSPPFSDLETVGIGGVGGSVHWNWGSTAALGLGGEGRKETSSAGSVGGLTPPQRKRGPQQQHKITTGSSSSGSGSDSNPKPSKLSSTSQTSPSSPTPTATPTSPPPKQKPTPPKLNLPSSTFTSPTSPSSVQSPNPRRGYQSPPPPLTAVPQRYGHRQYQPMPGATPSGNSKIPPGGDEVSGNGNSDAMYQALVREWCFAQGPSSSSGSAVSVSPGEMTPVVGGDLSQSQSALSRGLVCALGDE